MSKTTPAAIYYETAIQGSSKTKTNVIKFHAVIQEGHRANSIITKFPIQNGFEISNNSVKRNRTVKVEGIFTNTLLLNTKQISYSKTCNNSRVMFNALEALVQAKTMCKVVTNLGTYSPVLFTSFETTQKAGMVDSMAFTISGEELQVASNITNSSPKELTFFDLSDDKKAELTEKFFRANLNYDKRARVSVTETELGSSWTIKSLDSSGAVETSIYTCRGYDPDGDYYSYSLEKNMKQVYSTLGAKLTLPSTPTDGSLIGGLLGVSNCVLDKTTDLIEGIVESKIDSAIGKVKSTINGYLQEIVSIGGGSGILQSIIGFTMDCVTAEVADSLGYPDVDSVGDARQEADKAINRGLNSIRIKGKELVAEGKTGIKTFTKKAVTLTQISNPFKGALSKNGGFF